LAVVTVNVLLAESNLLTVPDAVIIVTFAALVVFAADFDAGAACLAAGAAWPANAEVVKATSVIATKLVRATAGDLNLKLMFVPPRE
jgi:hypothetical protein